MSGPAALAHDVLARKGQEREADGGLCLDNSQNKTLKAHLRDFGPNTTPGQVLESC